MKSRWRRTLIVCGVAVLVAGGVVLGIRFLLTAPVSLQGSQRVLIVQERATARDLATALARRRAIRSRQLFVLAARFKRLDRKLKAGGYLLHKEESILSLLHLLARGKIALRRVTVPEGFAVKQIALRLETLKLADANHFIALAARPTFPTPSWLPTNGVEGFLFPDTYYVPLTATEPEIFTLMLNRFDSAVLKPLGSQLRSSPLNLRQVVTLASIVEREAKVPKDRALIASVFLNRLRISKRLESCATVQYALGQHRQRLLLRDTEVDSAYNTYRHAGLPPGPICNPGRACVEAVLKPAKTDFLYFLARPDGSHVFTRTLAGHRQAIRHRRKEDVHR